MIKTVFLAGMTGFVGSRAIKDFVCSGIQVKALVRDVGKAQKKLAAMHFSPEQMAKVELIEGDLLTPTADTYIHLKSCDAVYHAAAKVGFLGSRSEYLETNYRATAALAAQAKRAGVSRFVYLSSQAAVRPIRWHLSDTQEKLSPATPYPSMWKMGLFHYGWAKQLAEKDLLTLSDASFAVTIFRPHVIWGIGDTTLANLLSEMGKKGSLTLVNGPHQCASSHIDTVLHYSHRALTGEMGTTGIFHVLDSSNMTMNQWLDSYTQALDLQVGKRISYRVAYVLGALLEGLGRLFGFTPPLDRFAVDGMGRSMHGDMNPTIVAFGPPPEINVAAEMEKFGYWYAQIRDAKEKGP